MKNTILLIILFTLSLNTIAQSDLEKSQLYKRKIETFTNMKTNGGALLLAGVIATAGGAGAMAYGVNHDIPGTFFVGYVGVLLGVPSIAGGLVLNSIGSRKLREYSDKLQNLNLSFNYNVNQPMLTVVYKF